MFIVKILCFFLVQVIMKFKLNWSVCRVCLKEGEELSTIFAKDENDVVVADKIMECGGITITRDTNLPQEICKKCSAFLSVAYKFRITCKSSDEVLRSFAEKKVESDVEDDVKDVNSLDKLADHFSENEIDLHDYSETVTVFENPVPEFLENVDDEDMDDHDNDDDDNDSTYEPPKEEVERDDDSDTEKPKREVKIEGDEDAPPRRKRGRPKKTDPPREKPAGTGKGRGPRGPRVKKETSKTLAMDSDGTPVIKYRNLNEKPQHICDVCGNVYKMRYSLDNHMRWHRKEKPYDCEICGAAFGLNSQLTRHMRTHTGQKPYECQYCGRRFSDLGTKNKHERTHTGERPYKCETCGKTFTYSHVLSAHKLTHTGEKRYSCDECGKRFTRAHHLKAHLSTLIHQKPSAEKQAAASATQPSQSLVATPGPAPTSSTAVTTTTTDPAPITMAVPAQVPDIKVQILPSQIMSNSNDSSHNSNPGNPTANMERAQPLPLFLF